MRNIVCAVALAAAFSAWTAAETPTEKAWSILDAGVKDKSTDQRLHAVLALGLLTANAKARGMAEAALKDPKGEVRAAAAAALDDMNAFQSATLLRAALDDKEVQVVLAAAHALDQLKDKSCYDTYYAVLTGRRKGTEGMVSSEMKEMRDPKNVVLAGMGFVPFGGIGVSLYQMMGNDRAAQVRAKAAEVLAADPDPKSGEALVQGAADKNWGVRVAALRAISRRGDASLVSTAEKGMADQKHAVSYTAAAAVIHLTKS